MLVELEMDGIRTVAPLMFICHVRSRSSIKLGRKVSGGRTEDGGTEQLHPNSLKIIIAHEIRLNRYSSQEYIPHQAKFRATLTRLIRIRQRLRHHQLAGPGFLLKGEMGRGKEIGGNGGPAEESSWEDKERGNYSARVVAMKGEIKDNGWR